MKKNKSWYILSSILLGKRYLGLTSISEQVRYMTMNSIFMVAMIPLIILGFTMLPDQIGRAIIDFTIAFLCLISLFLIRSKIPLRLVPLFPVTVFGAYCVYLLSSGDLSLWASIWLFAFPMIVIFLCRMTIGIIESVIVLVAIVLLMYTPISSLAPDNDIKMRYIGAYILIVALTVIYERISILKDRKEAALNAELAREKDIIQTMKDNIQHGIFLMDKDLKILPQFSQQMITILSYYDSELTGKNFLDILASLLDAKQLQIMKNYFSMVFSKSKKTKILEAANPISEFEYNADDRTKILSTRFHLIEQKDFEPMVIGIIQDITREKEFETVLITQKESRELEMKNLFDVIQIDPVVFQDFVEDTESNFNYINSILKDKSLTEKQVVTKFFQNVHAMKSNALILGLETFGNKLHTLEDDIKKLSDQKDITVDNILNLVLKLEAIMQEKDSYIKMIKRIEAFKTSNRLDSVLIHSLNKAVEKTSAETQKKVELKIGQIDLDILESKLRKPIKDILFQCVRNSIYHGIETVDERIQKNKKPVGTLTLNIKTTGEKIEVIFSDDGHGLNWEKIKAKYLRLHPESTDTSRKVLLSTIFKPEFSTSEDTTLVAGRGVGLSLVK
ncbi:MAG: hypothetical protein FWE72_09410, partial [Spirochaetaceae bacterium]|nr:hypothetical protein [Spirochaetaceae bacterium]